MTYRRGDTITALPELTKLFGVLAPLPPWEQAAGARRLAKELTEAAGALEELAQGAIAQMRKQGMTVDEIREMTEI